MEEKVGWDKIEFNQMIEFLQEELDNLKSSGNDSFFTIPSDF